MNNKESFTSYIVVFLFGIGAVVIYIVQFIYSTPEPSPRENIIYSAFELFLSIGIGWTLQGISSRKEFRDSMKQFALSAYRRISDIEKSVMRIRETITNMRVFYSKEKTHELDILSMATDELNSTVRSSIADWADIIGDELSKKDRIEELQKEKDALKNIAIYRQENLEVDNKIKKLQEEIDDQLTKLPYLLREQLSRPQDIIFNPVHYVIESYHREVNAHSCITIRIKVSNTKVLNNFEEKLPLRIVLIIGLSGPQILILNKNDEYMGEIINPFPQDGVISQNDFVLGLTLSFGAVTDRLINSTLSDGMKFDTPLFIDNARIKKIENEIIDLVIPCDNQNFGYG